MKIVALLTSRNRRDKTLAALESYFAQEGVAATLEAVLVDDASSDGTPEAVANRFPAVELVPGSGGLFWAGGMAVAEAHAARRNPDAFLWLNDDVVLAPDALVRLLEVAPGDADDRIAVGALRNPSSGTTAYSGVRRLDTRHPLRMRLVDPVGAPVPADSFNGNVVLVPRGVRRRVGPIDGSFAHALADLDYGFRAKRAGVLIQVATGYVGECPPHPVGEPWYDRTIPGRARLRLLLGRKGLPVRSRARYLRRHGGHGWILWWATPYIKFAFWSLGWTRLESR